MELRDYINIVKKRIWIILIIVPAFITGAILMDTFLFKNIYQANATLYVGKKTELQASIMYDDLLINQLLVKDYKEIMKSRAVSKRVVDELKKNGSLSEKFDFSVLTNNIDVNLRNDTRIIEVKVKNPSPQRAKDLTNKLAEVFKTKIRELMKVDNIEIIDWAQLPDSPIKPQKKKDAVLAGVIGLLSGMCLIFLLEYLDNTIKTSEDVEKYLGIPILGTIPNMSYIKGGKK